MGSAGMKRSTRAFGDRVVRLGKRLFAGRYEEVKRVRLISVAVVDTQENKVKLLDYGNVNSMAIDYEEQREIKWGKSKKMNGNDTNEVLGIDEEKVGFELGDNHDDGDNVSRIKEFVAVYTRKRKRAVPTDSSLKRGSFDENLDSDKMYEKKYFKKKRDRINLDSGFDGKYVFRKGPIVFAGPCSFKSDDNSSIYRFSCFVSSVLRYLRTIKLFSTRQFLSFLLLEPTASIYSSVGNWFPQDSTSTMIHGFFKVFGSINSIPFFSVNFNSLPFCFLYIHSNLLLKFAFLSYALLMHPIDENITNYDVKMPSVVTTKREPPLDILTVTKKARSARKRVPRVSLFNKFLNKNARAHVESIVPVPGVREIEGYAKEDYVPFMLSELYISSRSDEVSRTLEKNYPVYDMDSDDERWLKNFSNECVSEDIFEKVIDAFERGIYCHPHDFSEAVSAVDRCLQLASKEVLEGVYSYWMTKRKKKRSALIRVFQCYRRKRVIRLFTNAVLRKKRSFRRRVNQRFAEKQLDFKKVMLNDEKLLEKASKAYIKVHETQEALKKSEEAAIVKRQQAQALMEAADLATYRATMARRIAEARLAGGSVDQSTGVTLGSLDE